MPDQKKAMAMNILKAEVYSGPIPHPNHLKKYDEVLPGAADRIISMAEALMKHRQSLEQAVVFSGVEDSRRGQTFAFMICVLCILGGLFALYLDKDLIGLSVIISSVTALVGVFIYGRRSERKELENKSNLK